MQFSSLLLGLGFAASALARANAACTPADAISTLQAAFQPALGKIDLSKLDKAKIQRDAAPLIADLAPLLATIDINKLKPLLASLNIPFPADALNALLAAGAVAA